MSILKEIRYSLIKPKKLANEADYVYACQSIQRSQFIRNGAFGFRASVEKERPIDVTCARFKLMLKVSLTTPVGSQITSHRVDITNAAIKDDGEHINWVIYDTVQYMLRREFNDVYMFDNKRISDR